MNFVLAAGGLVGGDVHLSLGQEVDKRSDVFRDAGEALAVLDLRHEHGAHADEAALVRGVVEDPGVSHHLVQLLGRGEIHGADNSAHSGVDHGQAGRVDLSHGPREVQVELLQVQIERHGPVRVGRDEFQVVIRQRLLIEEGQDAFGGSGGMHEQARPRQAVHFRRVDVQRLDGVETQALDGPIHFRRKRSFLCFDGSPELRDECGNVRVGLRADAARLATRAGTIKLQLFAVRQGRPLAFPLRDDPGGRLLADGHEEPLSGDAPEHLPMLLRRPDSPRRNAVDGLSGPRLQLLLAGHREKVCEPLRQVLRGLLGFQDEHGLYVRTMVRRREVQQPDASGALQGHREQLHKLVHQRSFLFAQLQGGQALPDLVELRLLARVHQVCPADVQHGVGRHERCGVRRGRTRRQNRRAGEDQDRENAVAD